MPDTTRFTEAAQRRKTRGTIDYGPKPQKEYDKFWKFEKTTRGKIGRLLGNVSAPARGGRSVFEMLKKQGLGKKTSNVIKSTRPQQQDPLAQIGETLKTVGKGKRQPIAGVGARRKPIHREATKPWADF